MSDWERTLAGAAERYADGLARLPEDPDARQRQLTRTGNAAGAAALSLRMLGRPGEAAEWFRRAAERYRESWEGAPPGSWGRPIGAIKSRLLAGDVAGAEADSRWALEAGAAAAESPIGGYAAALALLTLGRDGEAAAQAERIRRAEGFPPDVGDALLALAAGDAAGYETAVSSVLRSFETRTEYLEDIPVADTVLVLQELAAPRGLAVGLASELLP
jgi:hypothetical protein